MIRLGTEAMAAGVRRRRPRAPTYPTPAAVAERPRLARPKKPTPRPTGRVRNLFPLPLAGSPAICPEPPAAPAAAS